MNVVGLITEYNPFHNGHKYHIEEAKRLTNADYVVVVMSGNFVQRGTPAMIDKYSRAKMALFNGADLVFELPTCFSTASAEYFALGAISLLNSLNFVTSIVFGSECGDIHLLTQIAKLLHQEPPELSAQIQHFIKEGLTYPIARANALQTFFDAKEVLTSPNNILGIEYIKALLRLNSSIIPYTITRIGSGFHDPVLKAPCECSPTQSIISSATAIRSAVETFDTTRQPSSMLEKMTRFQDAMPDNAYQILNHQIGHTCPIRPNDMNVMLNYKLLSETSDTLEQYFDVSKDLSRRILIKHTDGLDYDTLVSSIKSKQYTQTRIQRCLCHILLNITTEDMNTYCNHGYSQYARLLGFRTSASMLLKDNPFIIKKLKSAKLSQVGSRMLATDLFASRIYNLLLYQKFNTTIKNEYQQGILLFE